MDGSFTGGVYSDHHPLLILMSGENVGNQNRPFRFEAVWLLHEGFRDVINSKWRRNVHVEENLEGLKIHLKEWNKHTFGNIHYRKKKNPCSYRRNPTC